jgi:hypothetical protein
MLPNRIAYLCGRASEPHDPSQQLLHRPRVHPVLALVLPPGLVVEEPHGPSVAVLAGIGDLDGLGLQLGPGERVGGRHGQGHLVASRGQNVA